MGVCGLAPFVERKMPSYHIADGFETAVASCTVVLAHAGTNPPFRWVIGAMLALLRLTGSTADPLPNKARMITASTNVRSARFRRVRS
jgi:hypothetical protein